MLDFIGNANRRFRFDQRYRALTETTRAGVIKQIEEGFPFLPAGCTIQLDRVSTDLVLENLKESIGANVKTFVRELQQIGRDVGLAEFLREAGVSLEELYRNAGWTWTGIRREANLPTLPPGPRETQLSRALGRLLHQDDPLRLAFLQAFLSQPQPPPTASLTESQRRILLGFTSRCGATRTHGRRSTTRWRRCGSIPRSSLSYGSCFLCSRMRPRTCTHPLGADAPWTNVPLSVHASYSLDEILAAFGEMTLSRPASHS